jgi:hypothetical protein
MGSGVCNKRSSPPADSAVDRLVVVAVGLGRGSECAMTRAPGFLFPTGHYVAPVPGGVCHRNPRHKTAVADDD